MFSTKKRERILTPVIQTELHPYLAGTLDNIGCPLLQVGGVEDHVRLFFGLSRRRTIAEAVEKVKTRIDAYRAPLGRPLTRDGQMALTGIRCSDGNAAEGAVVSRLDAFSIRPAAAEAFWERPFTFGRLAEMRGIDTSGFGQALLELSSECEQSEINNPQSSIVNQESSWNSGAVQIGRILDTLETS